ncbi:mitochondrial import inner membrane translocase subunit Tim54 [Kockiozyma suomiensis]|uniref:mitochondrial import inner membrane translocase subunit Tim54 n=1 Tax=Kockiozyma suomiensis TaxID=1337062 RepID=UPI0033434445
MSSEMSTSTPPVPEKPRNPVFEAMGIPRIRLPGPKMSVFLLTVAGIAGLIYYDKRERRANRQKWKDRVSHFAEQPLPVTALTRKVTVYLSPPPGDHMEVTMEHFTQYVKPILTAAAIDWELVKEQRQGDIRYEVAEAIRRQRRGDDDRTPEQKALSSVITRDTDGGAICIGRGAYKEYLHGVHEGWLGPLEPPASLEPVATTPQPPSTEPAADVKDSFVESADIVINEANASSAAAESGVVTAQTPPGANESEKPVSEEEQKIKDEEQKKKDETAKKSPKAYISTEDYATAPTPAEFSKIDHLEPIMYIPHPHILGFRHTPIRTYRYFTKRNLADKVGAVTAAVVLNNFRQFIPRIDVEAGKHEEDEWPVKWKQTGIEKGSEWMQDVVVDERVVDKLRVYELPNNLDDGGFVKNDDGFVADK